MHQLPLINWPHYWLIHQWPSLMIYIYIIITNGHWFPFWLHYTLLSHLIIATGNGLANCLFNCLGIFLNYILRKKLSNCSNSYLEYQLKQYIYMDIKLIVVLLCYDCFVQIPVQTSNLYCSSLVTLCCLLQK